jgi:hypothetical protein
LALSDDLAKELCSRAIQNVYKLDVVPPLNAFKRDVVTSTEFDPSIYQSIWTEIQPAMQLIASIPLDNQHTL